jgi:hypothetical protein
MQKTKNNKIPQEATSKEHNIVDIPRKHDLVLEIHASMSEKHTLAHETPKPPKRRPEKTTEKTPSTTIKGGRWRGNGGGEKNGEVVLPSSMFFP